MASGGSTIPIVTTPPVITTGTVVTPVVTGTIAVKEKCFCWNWFIAGVITGAVILYLYNRMNKKDK